MARSACMGEVLREPRVAGEWWRPALAKLMGDVVEGEVGFFEWRVHDIRDFCASERETVSMRGAGAGGGRRPFDRDCHTVGLTLVVGRLSRANLR